MIKKHILHADINWFLSNKLVLQFLNLAHDLKLLITLMLTQPLFFFFFCYVLTLLFLRNKSNNLKFNPEPNKISSTIILTYL